MNIVEKKSPNGNERQAGMMPTMLILHYTGTITAEEADEIYMTPARVAPHYMIAPDARITKYMQEEARAWHAGHASWNGCTDINSASIGIEVVNDGHESGLPGFPGPQIGALIELIDDIRTRWAIPDHLILGHSDIAPGRKIDPGEHFPWAVLRDAGIGLMPHGASTTAEIDSADLQSALKLWGYDYADDLDLIVREFTRHYLPDEFGRPVDLQRIDAALRSLVEQKNLTS